MSKSRYSKATKGSAVVGFASNEYQSKAKETCFGSSSADDVQLTLVRVGVDEESVVRWKVHFPSNYESDQRVHITPFQGQVKFARGDCGAEVWIRINEIAYVKQYFTKKRKRFEETMFYYMWGEPRSFTPSFEFEVHLEAGDEHTSIETVKDAKGQGTIYESARVKKRPLTYTPWHYLSWAILKTRSFGIVVSTCILYILFGMDMAHMYLDSSSDAALMMLTRVAAFVFTFELALRGGVGGSTYAFTTKCFLDVAVIIGLLLSIGLEGLTSEYVNSQFSANQAAKYTQYGRYARSAGRASRVVKLPQLLGYLTDATLWFTELFSCVTIAYSNYRFKQQELKIRRAQIEAAKKARLDVLNAKVRNRIKAQSKTRGMLKTVHRKPISRKTLASPSKLNATTALFRITAIDPDEIERQRKLREPKVPKVTRSWANQFLAVEWGQLGTGYLRFSFSRRSKGGNDGGDEGTELDSGGGSGGGGGGGLTGSLQNDPQKSPRRFLGDRKQASTPTELEAAVTALKKQNPRPRLQRRASEGGLGMRRRRRYSCPPNMDKLQEAGVDALRPNHERSGSEDENAFQEPSFLQEMKIEFGRQGSGKKEDEAAAAAAAAAAEPGLSGRNKLTSNLNVFRGLELMQRSKSYRQIVEFITNKLVMMLVIVQVTIPVLLLLYIAC
jgi:hypothetical protein